MQKMITCSFDEQGVVMTAWNGVHPDKLGHFSVTKLISRTDFNEAVKNRALFSDILGIDITFGWANALKMATYNAQNLKIDIEKSAEFVAKGLAAIHGDKVIKKAMNAAELENKKIEKELKEKTKNGIIKTAGIAKGGKKRGRPNNTEPSI